MKTVILCILLSVTAFTPKCTNAGEGHEHHNTTEIYQTDIYQTDIYQNFNYITAGVASSMAQSQIHPDWNTLRWQYGLGVAHYKGNTGLALGFSKNLSTGKFPKNPLVTVTVGYEEDRRTKDDDLSISAGFNGRF